MDFDEALSTVEPLAQVATKYRVTVATGSHSTYGSIRPGGTGIMTMGAIALNTLIDRHNRTLADDSLLSRNRGLLITGIEPVTE